MTNIRFPILIWKEFNGQYCACAVHEPADSTAIGHSRSDVLDQIKNYFAYIHQREFWRSVPDFDEVRLTYFKVPIHPESRNLASEERNSRQRQLFAAPPVSLSVACVHGNTEGGLLFAAVPLLNVFFTYDGKDRLKDSLVHYVQQSLRGRTLEQILRLLTPTELQLDELIVHLDKPRKPLPTTHLKTLQATADPISDRDHKTGLARPWQRDTLVESLFTFFSKEKASAILVGGPGVGKSALLAEAARRAQREFSPPLSDAENKQESEQPDATTPLPRIWQTSGARIIAGMKYLGQWQERCEAIISELAEINGILCFERLLDLVSSGGRDPSAGIGAFLAPYIRRGELRIVAEATPEELDACRRLLPGLVDACRQFVVEPLTGGETVLALEQVAAVLAPSSRIALDPVTLAQTYRLFNRFQPYHPMPGPAVQFLTELFDDAATRKLKRVGPDLVLKHFTRRTGLPDWLLRDDLPLKRDDILAQFQQSIIGQPDACAAAADIILAFKAGVNDPQRPLGVMLFAGPTGVGKTELAKTIGSFLFGHGEHKDRLVRLDMSEFSGGSAAHRLLGPPDGEPSPLIRRIRQQPFNVILLDEIEKASSDVFDLLLGLFDEGRLTDRFGRLTTFRSTILIMTSNLGSAAAEPFGLSVTAARSYESEIAAFFRPEFFNRLDSIVTFNPLDRSSMLRIAEKELQSLAGREGLAKRKILLQWTPALTYELVRSGFDPRYGARPLQRTLEDLITTPLAKRLASTPTFRNRAITIDFDPASGITFRGG